jgi:hypothetical protein
MRSGGNGEARKCNVDGKEVRRAIVDAYAPIRIETVSHDQKARLRAGARERQAGRPVVLHEYAIAAGRSVHARNRAFDGRVP